MATETKKNKSSSNNRTLFKTIEESRDTIGKREKFSRERIGTAKKVRLDDMELSARVSHCLKNAKIFTLKELLDMPIASLLRIKSFGKTSLKEVCKIARSFEKNPQDFLDRQIGSVKEEGGNVLQQNVKKPDGRLLKEGLSNILIDDLGLSVRAKNILSACGIEYFSQLCATDVTGLNTMRNCGEKTIQEISDLKNRLLKNEVNIETKTVEKKYKDISVEKLNLSVRAYNALKLRRVATIEDLFNISRQQMVQMKNVGNKTINEIEKAKRFVLEEPDKAIILQDNMEKLAEQNDNIAGLIRGLGEIRKIREKHIELFIARHLLPKDRYLKLTKKNKISRARMYQINLLVRQAIWETLSVALKSAIEAVKSNIKTLGLMPLKEIDKVFNEFYGWNKTIEKERNFVLNLVLEKEHGIFCDQTDSGKVLWSFRYYKGKGKYEKSISNIIKSQKKVNLDELQSQINKEIGKTGYCLTTNFLKCYIIHYGAERNIYLRHGTAVLDVMKGVKRIKVAIYEILKMWNKPLHYKDIADRLRKYDNFINVSNNSVHSALGWHPKIEYVARGTYALKEWNMKRALTYTEQIEDIMESNNGPMKLRDIVSIMDSFGYGKETNIRASLDQNPLKFAKISPKIYCLRKHYERDKNIHARSPKEDVDILKELIGI
jgi:DNA-directed RNA polymerase alpha subunit